MDDDIRKKERVLDKLAVEDDIETKRLSISQKRALEREARQSHGRDWKKILGAVKSIHVNKEAAQTLHGMGIGGDELRDLSKPKGLRRYR